VSRKDINVLAGIIQAVSHMADQVGAGWIIPAFALLLSLSIAGIGSAWVAGSARIPFVAGLDSCLPRWLGKVHRRYHTPHAALIVQFVISSVLVLISFLGSGVQETFQRLLSLAVVLQLVPFIYMFAAILKIALDRSAAKGHYRRVTLALAGGSGLLMTCLGILFAFSPAQQITSLFEYEAWMTGGTVAFVGLAVFFFYVYARRGSVRRATTS
jgi:amino acid transporter